MTQPKFPWALLRIVAMFTFIAISPKSPSWIVVFAIFAVIVTAASAIYQVIPRREDTGDVDPTFDDDAPGDQDPS